MKPSKKAFVIGLSLLSTFAFSSLAEAGWGRSYRGYVGYQQTEQDFLYAQRAKLSAALADVSAAKLSARDNDVQAKNLEQEFSRLNNRRSYLRSIRASGWSAQLRIRSEISQITARLAVVEQELDKVAAAKPVLEAKLAQAENLAKALSVYVNAVVADISSRALREQLKEKQAMLAAMLESVSKARQAVSDNNALAKGIERHALGLKAQLRALSIAYGAIDSRWGRLNSNAQQRDALRKQMNEASAKLTALTQELSKAKADGVQLVEWQAVLENNAKGMAAYIDTLNAKIASLAQAPANTASSGS